MIKTVSSVNLSLMPSCCCPPAPSKKSRMSRHECSLVCNPALTRGCDVRIKCPGTCEADGQKSVFLPATSDHVSLMSVQVTKNKREAPAAYYKPFFFAGALSLNGLCRHHYWPSGKLSADMKRWDGLFFRHREESPGCRTVFTSKTGCSSQLQLFLQSWP